MHAAHYRATLWGHSRSVVTFCAESWESVLNLRILSKLHKPGLLCLDLNDCIKRPILRHIMIDADPVRRYSHRDSHRDPQCHVFREISCSRYYAGSQETSWWSCWLMVKSRKLWRDQTRAILTPNANTHTHTPTHCFTKKAIWNMYPK